MKTNTTNTLPEPRTILWFISILCAQYANFLVIASLLFVLCAADNRRQFIGYWKAHKILGTLVCIVAFLCCYPIIRLPIVWLYHTFA